MMDMIYFSKPLKVYWDLKNLQVGDLAIVYSNDSGMQQFSNHVDCEIINIDYQTKLVNIKLLPEKSPVTDKNINLNIKPIYYIKSKNNIYTLPFDYLINIQKNTLN